MITAHNSEDADSADGEVGTVIGDGSPLKSSLKNSAGF